MRFYAAAVAALLLLVESDVVEGAFRLEEDLPPLRQQQLNRARKLYKKGKGDYFANYYAAHNLPYIDDRYNGGACGGDLVNFETSVLVDFDGFGEDRAIIEWQELETVSYTHLTLPTKA